MVPIIFGGVVKCTDICRGHMMIETEIKKKIKNPYKLSCDDVQQKYNQQASGSIAHLYNQHCGLKKRSLLHGFTWTTEEC